MPDYRVLFEVPGSPMEALFETVVTAVDTPREAGAIGTARWQLTTPEMRADAWLEVLELPEEVLVLRLPVCTSARTFAPRFFQTPPRDDAFALRYDFTSIRLSRDSHPRAVEHARHTTKKTPRVGTARRS
jgi:hypothetical protein